MKDITPPTIHMGGTSPESLLDGYKKVLDALRKAESALALYGPNGRDYYLQNSGGFSKAQEEHEARLQALRSIQEEIRYIAQSIYDQKLLRQART